MVTDPPRWATVAAYAAVLSTLPSGLWRIAMGLGWPVGYSPEVLRDLYDVPGWGTLSNIVTSIVQVSLSLLTLGLVYRWGEVVPHRVPLIGGRRVPTMAAVIPAGLGAVVLTLLALSQLVLWNRVDHGSIAPAGRTIMGYSYLPLVLWGPLLGAVTVSYYRRRRTSAVRPR